MSRTQMNLALAATLALAPAAASAASFYESFDYNTGNVTGNGAAANGFSAAWAIPAGATTGTIASPGLTYGSLVTAGNTWADADGTTRFNERSFDNTSFGTDGTSAWFSFLFNATSTDNNTIYTGLVSSSANYSTSGFGVIIDTDDQAIRARVGTNFTATNAVAAGVWTTGATTLVVGRIDFKPGNDDLRIWVNPALNATPDDALATVSNLGAASIPAVPSLLSIRGGGSTRASVDEWRLGDTFASVTPVPEPGVATLAGLASLAVLGRRRGRAC